MTKPILKGISITAMNQLFSSQVTKTLTSKIRQKKKRVMPASVVWGFLPNFPICSILIWNVGDPGSDLSSVSAFKNAIPGSGMKAPSIGKVSSVPHTKRILLCTSPDQERM